MPAYSFLDTVATITGPGGVVNLGAGAAVAEEGITIEPVGEKNEMVIGADGKGQHSLIAGDPCKVTVRLLKTSPTNKALGIMFDLQKTSSALWGQNLITCSNTGLGDYTSVQSCAFGKKPTLNYAQKGGFNEWTWDGIQADTIFGAKL